MLAPLLRRLDGEELALACPDACAALIRSALLAPLTLSALLLAPLASGLLARVARLPWLVWLLLVSSLLSLLLSPVLSLLLSPVSAVSAAPTCRADLRLYVCLTLVVCELDTCCICA
jgi:hypothetical protein